MFVGAGCHLLSKSSVVFFKKRHVFFKNSRLLNKNRHLPNLTTNFVTVKVLFTSS